MRSPVTWIGILVIALAGGAYLLYRRSQSAAAASTTAATAGTGTTTPTDYSGQVATLQTEIMDLQSSEAQPGDDEDKDKTTTGGKKTTKPPVPKNLHVANNTGSGVQIAWDLPGGIGEDIMWMIINHEGTAAGPVVDRFYTNNTLANLGGPLAKPKGLRPNARYVVTVQGHNPAGTGPQASLGYTTAAAKKRPVPAPKPRPKPRPKTTAHHVTRKAA